MSVDGNDPVEKEKIDDVEEGVVGVMPLRRQDDMRSSVGASV